MWLLSFVRHLELTSRQVYSVDIMSVQPVPSIKPFYHQLQVQFVQICGHI